MKKIIKIGFMALSLIGLMITSTSSCKKDNPSNGIEPVFGNGVLDSDGNHYITVIIGNQEWMAENLKTTKYMDGSDIFYIGSDNTAWENNTSGAYAWYDNDETNSNTYGALYNWYAVVNTKGLCPSGWHVPSETEWSQLISYLKGKYDLHNDGANSNINGVGNFLKSCRQVNSPSAGNCNTAIHPRWDSNSNHYGTNKLGFSSLPGGSRYYVGIYDYLGFDGRWWSATEVNELNIWSFSMHSGVGSVNSNDYLVKNDGLSVRCVKDD